jgi:ketosteroid isomerase-like protein
MSYPERSESEEATAELRLVGRDDSAAARFVRAFTEVWARPDADRLGALLHPDVRLAGPMMNTTVGQAAGQEELRRLIALWPDVRVEVRRWSAAGPLVFIEFILHATFAGRPLRIPAIDRILLKDGKCVERVTYVSEPLALLAALVTRPSGWLRWWRAGVGPPRRRCRLAT